ncbi:hypothetical protein F5Y13DRAFT_176311 [Hypoxylon sp. FL1857]|nr:hypothetical protein F5Y13DRAFT_176311 [Hypoxylon sp. FL1857]
MASSNQPSGLALLAGQPATTNRHPVQDNHPTRTADTITSDRGKMGVVTDPIQRIGRLDVFHPYLSRHSALATFAATEPGHGVWYPLVYYTMCVIAGNCWDESEGYPLRRPDGTAILDNQGRKKFVGPFLSEERDPQTARPIEPPSNGVLTVRGPQGDGPRRLYFHVPKKQGMKFHDEYGYPITPSFEEWCFPESIPKLWTYLPDFSGIPEPNPPRCFLTGNYTGFEMAHVVPKTCATWAEAQLRPRVSHHLSTASVVQSRMNLMPLRQDVHTIYDSSILVPFPKPIASSPTKFNLFACIVIAPSTLDVIIHELVQNFQNFQFDPLYNIPHDFIFARFAWSIFCTTRMPLLSPIVYQRYARTTLNEDRSGYGDYEEGGTRMDGPRPRANLHSANGGYRYSGSKRGPVLDEPQSGDNTLGATADSNIEIGSPEVDGDGIYDDSCLEPGEPDQPLNWVQIYDSDNATDQPRNWIQLCDPNDNANYGEARDDDVEYELPPKRPRGRDASGATHTTKRARTVSPRDSIGSSQGSQGEPSLSASTASIGSSNTSASARNAPKVNQGIPTPITELTKDNSDATSDSAGRTRAVHFEE